MYTRKQVRYSINRCSKPGDHPAQYQEIYDHVMSIKPDNLDLADFTKTWDIIIDKNKEILFVEPERDINFIQTTCIEAKMLTKTGLPFDELTDRQANIVSIVETAMLDGLMEWETFGANWVVKLNSETGQIQTMLTNVDSGQKRVTPEMIVRSNSGVDESKLDEETKRRIADKEDGKDGKTDMEMKPMSDDDIEKFEAVLTKMQSDKKKTTKKKT